MKMQNSIKSVNQSDKTKVPRIEHYIIINKHLNHPIN